MGVVIAKQDPLLPKFDDMRIFLKKFSNYLLPWRSQKEMVWNHKWSVPELNEGISV